MGAELVVGPGPKAGLKPESRDCLGTWGVFVIFDIASYPSAECRFWPWFHLH